LKISNHKLCQFIVKIAQRLIKRFDSFEFWDNLKELKSPPPSLAWFLKPEGKAFLLKEYETFKLILNKEQVILKENKIGEDKKVCQNPKTLLEFIRNK
jgi:hypothetical protein